jgi:DNA-binding NarL/FixJ family response regulator
MLAYSPSDAVEPPASASADVQLVAPAVLSAVIVDAHASVREGLPPLLRTEGIEVLGATATGAGGLALIERYEPDLALVAIDLPDVDGLVLLRRIVECRVRSAVVLYADAEGGEQAALAVHAGAAGVVGRRRTIAELIAALRLVAGGGLWFGENAAAEADPEPAPAPPVGARRTAALSGSELRVLALVADGRSTEEAAETLSLSPHTVRTHLRNVMRKLEASSRAHAVAIAMAEAAISV